MTSILQPFSMPNEVNTNSCNIDAIGDDVFQWIHNEEDLGDHINETRPDDSVILEYMQSKENKGRSSNDNWSGYKSNEDDDEKDTNTNDESPLAKIARFMRGNDFKSLIGGKIMLKKGQVFDNVDHFREIL